MREKITFLLVIVFVGLDCVSCSSDPPLSRLSADEIERHARLAWLSLAAYRKTGASERANITRDQKFEVLGYKDRFVPRGEDTSVLIVIDKTEKIPGIVIAIAGTESKRMTRYNAKIHPAKINGAGFYGGFASYWGDVKTSMAGVLPTGPTEITLTGHSLGGAASVVGAHDLASEGREIQEVVIFGTPRCAKDIPISLEQKITSYHRDSDLVVSTADLASSFVDLGRAFVLRELLDLEIPGNERTISDSGTISKTGEWPFINTNLETSEDWNGPFELSNHSSKRYAQILSGKAKSLATEESSQSTSQRN